MDSNLYEEKEGYMKEEVPPSWIEYDDMTEMTEADADAKFAGQTITTTTKESWGGIKVHQEHSSNRSVSSVSSEDSSSHPQKNSIVDNNKNIQHESAIEKEIRIARERESELKREQEERLKAQSPDMPIHKIPEPVHVDDFRRGPPPPRSPTVVTTVTTTQQSSYRELPEADRDTAMSKRESFIEREIREQEERERALKQDGMYVPHQQQNKEAEQSEFERKEKEHERVLAHESIVDREIREQREREQEVLILRQSSTQVTVTKPSEEILLPASAQPPREKASSMTSSESEFEVTPAPMPTSSQRVAYEDAIKMDSHQGESFIARELREQREREEELRSRYKEMGLGGMLATQDPPDTPFNRPEPAQPDITKLPVHAKTNINRKMSKSVSEPVHISAGLPPPPRAPKAQVDITVKTSVSHDTLSLSSKSTDPIVEEPETPKVKSVSMLPSDEADGFDHSYRFVPQNETPIEREMRLSREREEELRQVRGLPKNPVQEEGTVIELKDIVIPESKPPVNYKKGDEGDGKYIQRFASSRLQHEIEKEKRRELDLKSQGMINTLSEERVSGPTKYIDVIPHEANTKTVPNWKLQQQKSSNPTSHDAQDAMLAVASKTTVTTSETSLSPRNGASPVPPQTVTVTTSQVSFKKNEPAVVQRYSVHTKELITKETDKYRQRPSPNLAESRIEQELREMKAREEELSPFEEESVSLRRSISDYQVPSANGEMRMTSPVPANGHEAEMRAQSLSGDSAKSSRRKSALAEEWEKKFGAN